MTSRTANRTPVAKPEAQAVVELQSLTRHAPRRRPAGMNKERTIMIWEELARIESARKWSTGRGRSEE